MPTPLPAYHARAGLARLTLKDGMRRLAERLLGLAEGEPDGRVAVARIHEDLFPASTACSPTDQRRVESNDPPSDQPVEDPMTALTLAIPDSALSALRRSPTEFGREMKLAAAIHWYGRGMMSQERAAELAGMNRRDFIRALAREGVDVFVLDDDSLARELAQAEGGATTSI